MSNTEPIVLEGIPVFTGNLATLDVKVTELSSVAESVATTTGDVHSSFGGLQAFYQAPEAEQLFATTKPVVDTGQKLKSDLTAISRALSTYSDEVYPLVEKLKEIKRDAGAFLVKINADDKWREDGDLVDENNHRRDEIRETWAAFQEAEIACYNKIVALVCGVPLKKHDGSDSAHQYGYDAETLEHVEGLPWGDPLVESIPGWQVWEHAWEFTKGFFVDGVWGTIKGLGTLVGFDGFDAAGQAWKGLAQLATGVAITIVPGAAEAFWTADEKDLPSWLRDSRTAVKETGKALLAWDQWGDNPSRAAGAVTFNVVTTVFTGGTGAAASGAGKAALAAKALTAAGKVGRIVDPMTYVFKGAGAGLSRIGDVMAGLKNLGKIETPPLPDNVFTLPDGWTRLPDGTLDVPAGATLPHGATRLPDGTVKLPDGTIALPEGTIKNPFDEGAAYADLNGNLYDQHGNLIQKAAEAPREAGRTTDTDTPNHTHVETPTRQPVLVGAGARVDDAADNRIRMGGADRVDNAPGNSADNPYGHHSREPGYAAASHEQPISRAGDSPGESHPFEEHSDGLAGGSHEHSVTRQDESPGSQGAEAVSTGPDTPGSSGGGGQDSGGWDKSPDERGPFNRGGETEQLIRDLMRRSGAKPGDLEKALANLANNPAGAEIADIIASGNFKNSPHFDQVVSSLSQADKMSGGIEQLRLANRLHEAGIMDISFEMKGDVEIKPGIITGEATDLDVMARDSSGRVHGYQFKEIQNPKKVVGKIFANMKQLETSGADFKTFVVDTKGTLADHLTFRTQQRLTEVYGNTNIQFIIRVEDGVLSIPPSGTFMPEGTP